MELKPLKSFIAVATLKSFSAAARELHTVQPAISRHISSLEEELGTPLFIRNTRDVHITAAGLQLLKDAKTLIKQEEETKFRTLQAAKGELGSLRVGYLPSACLTFIPDLVQRFRLQYPNVDIRLFAMTASEQLAAFDQDEIDVGISRPLPKEHNTAFNSHLLYTDQLSVIVSTQHPFSKYKAIRLSDIKQENVILFHREEAVGLFDGIINLCQQYDFSPHIAAQPRHMQTLLTMVASGLGIAIAPTCISKLFIQGCQFIPIKDIHADVLTQIHCKKTEFTPTAKAFVKIAMQSVELIHRDMQSS